jgi:signal transduction histidine kinase
MMFRRKLLALLALTVCLAVGAVAWLVSEMTRRAFARSDDERTASLVAQFRREFNRYGDQVERQVGAIAASEAVNQMALSMDHKPADPGPYFESAKIEAQSAELDFLEFVQSDGTIISSAQWPERFGYSEEAFGALEAESEKKAFLKREPLPGESALGLFCVRATKAGETPIFVVGGRRLDRNFISALNLPAGMRVVMYLNQRDHFSVNSLVDPGEGSTNPAHPADNYEPIVEAVRSRPVETIRLISWTSDSADDEVFHAIPLMGESMGQDHPLLAILLVGNARRSYVELKRRIQQAALLVGGGGIALAILLSSWAAARVTRPVEQLALAAQEVTAGNWHAQVTVEGSDELSQLADSFNRMTAELLEQKDRLMQAERVAAWRELARRLAHELKNPLFPLQLTVENMLRARQQGPEQFEEVFQEGSKTLLTEISNLKGIIARFSDFSQMPQLQLRPVQVNQVLRGVMQLFEARLASPEHGQIVSELQMDPYPATIMADAEMLHRAISNLVLNAIDAMPEGGRLTLRSRCTTGLVVVEVVDTGSGLTAEECERIFTPYYTSKPHGTGLGLAIVQSVVSDHGGRIRVRSEPGRGTTIAIELPHSYDLAHATD